MEQWEQEKVFMDAFAHYGDAIFRFCMVKVSNKELAEDMTQEVFLRCWQYLRDNSAMTNTRSLLYTIANNLAKDWYKKKKVDSLDDRLEQGLEPRDENTGPEVDASYQEVLATLQELEEQDREVLLLRYVEGLEPKDIAEVLEESANTISVRLNRATKRLQQKLRV